MTALIVRELDLELVEGQQVDTITQNLTIIPAFGIKVRVKRNPSRRGTVNEAPLDEAKEASA
jgi:hypothetical protein